MAPAQTCQARAVASGDDVPPLGIASPGSSRCVPGSSWTSTVQTPNSTVSHRGCLSEEPPLQWGQAGAKTCLSVGRLHYSLTAQARAVIKISFLKIKYLSANMISGCEEPGPAAAREAEGCPQPGMGVWPSRVTPRWWGWRQWLLCHCQTQRGH